MKWPFVLRSTLDWSEQDLNSQIEQHINNALSLTNESSRLTVLLVQTNEKLALKESDVSRLTVLLAKSESQKCNHYTSKNPESGTKASTSTTQQHSRSGWRSRAKEASKHTLPKPKDSVSALQQKVISEGGTL